MQKELKEYLKNRIENYPFENQRLSFSLDCFYQEMKALFSTPSPMEWLSMDSLMSDLVKQYPVFQWCGIYRVEGENLVLSVYRGEPTPHPVINKSSGICGAAVKENRTLNIPDVGSDPRYLSCDFRTKSELVVPVRDEKGNAIAELDIDSHTHDAFTSEITKAMEIVVKEKIEPFFKKCGLTI